LAHAGVKFIDDVVSEAVREGGRGGGIGLAFCDSRGNNKNDRNAFYVLFILCAMQQTHAKVRDPESGEYIAVHDFVDFDLRLIKHGYINIVSHTALPLVAVDIDF